MNLVDMRNTPKMVAWPCDMGGCGQYRMLQPLYYLSSAGYVLADILSHFFVALQNYSFYQVLIFERQCTNEQLVNIAKVRRFRDAAKLNFRMVYDCDDLFHEVHAENVLAKKFYTEERVNNILKIMTGLVDQVSFSTHYLRNYYTKLGVKNSVVLLNRLPRYLWSFPPREDFPTQKLRILWSGSSSHHGSSNDTEILKELLARTKGISGVKWIFLGTKPDWLSLNDAIFVPWKSFFVYPRALWNIKADIGLIPLVDTDFNRGKSDLKLLEYSACGIPAVCSSIPQGPYELAPCKVQNDPSAWVSVVERLAKDKEFYLEVRQKQYTYLKTRWLEDNAHLWFSYYTGTRLPPS